MKLSQLGGTALAIFIMLASSCMGRQQPPKVILEQQPVAYSLPTGVHEVSVRFKLVNNHVLVPVIINGKGPFDFILDTGMRDPGGILLWQGDWLKDVNLDLAEGTEAQIGGAGKGQGAVTAQVAEKVQVGIGDIVLRDAHAIVAPPLPVAFQYHRGVIGGALLSNFVVTINYDDSLVTFTEPDHFKSPILWTRVPLTFLSGIPYVSALLEINGKENVPATLVVDLGASPPVSLNTEADERITVPPRHLATEIGRGVSGVITGDVARLDALSLGGYILTNVVATFPDSADQFPRGADSRSGNLGNGLLHHFNVIFDYGHNRMYITPNRLFDEPFEWRMTGFVLGKATEKGAMITWVDESSPASEMGIEAGDVLLSINGKNVLDYKLEEVRKLTRTAGNKLELRLERDGRISTVELTTRQLI